MEGPEGLSTHQHEEGSSTTTSLALAAEGIRLASGGRGEEVPEGG